MAFYSSGSKRPGFYPKRTSSESVYRNNSSCFCSASWELPPSNITIEIFYFNIIDCIKLYAFKRYTPLRGKREGLCKQIDFPHQC